MVKKLKKREVAIATADAVPSVATKIVSEKEGAAEPIEAALPRTKKARNEEQTKAEVAVDELCVKKKKKRRLDTDARGDLEDANVQSANEDIPNEKRKKKKKSFIAADVEALQTKKDSTSQQRKRSSSETGDNTKVSNKKGSVKKKDSGAVCSHKVCVSGLPWHVGEELLRQDFSECGDIGALVLLTENHNGEVRSRGIAFISFATTEGMAEALKYNGTEYGGRIIKVNPALEREQRKDFQGKGEDTGKSRKSKGKGNSKGKGKGKPRAPLGEKPEYCTSILVKSLPQVVTEDDLYTFFKDCGAGGPTNIRVLTSAASKRLAFVDFDDTDAVDQAIKLNGADLKGTPAHLDYSKPRQHKIRK